MSTGTLGGDALVGGITLSREFPVEPYFVRYPTLSMSTPVATPSIVEVHVNGRLVREERVAPGRLDIRNLPLTTGQNDTRIVIRDAFGGTRELSTGFYSTASVLATGVQDYQYPVGFERESLATSSCGLYGAGAARAAPRWASPTSLTAGGRIEARPSLVSGGPTMTFRLPVGELDTASAQAARITGFGTAASASYSYSGRMASVGGRCGRRTHATRRSA